MKTAIVYISAHHENTKKLVDSIAAANEVAVFDAAKEESIDLSNFDCIGFASGIVNGDFYPSLLSFMEGKLPSNKNVFFLYTCGMKRKGYTEKARNIAMNKECKILGEYGCLGFDTFGPLKMIGGIAKGHPTDSEIKEAVAFFTSIIEL